ncbi:MAG: nucleotidyltransferase family protein [Paenibacillus sp.]|uniref:nucleotidyltransferase family protein n=1 Tax=Paenibacillus sp. TaxID=58172 RepID=UPI0025F28C14|nr:nucleotidyltransferase family protein [Paenibacillus sp.]MBR2566497.1 nucleotidyltransferase family protein [Paenibacillus sp.]
MQYEERLCRALRQHEQIMQDLRLVRELELPDCYIGAGYIRNYIWDELHGYASRELHSDIDVVYFDAANLLEERDRQLEKALYAATGNRKWSVKNQARMHLQNGDAPYHSTEDALRFWPEQVTAIAVQLAKDDQIRVCAPYGLEDLYTLVVRKSPAFTKATYYNERVRRKNWQEHWPKLTIVHA